MTASHMKIEATPSFLKPWICNVFQKVDYIQQNTDIIIKQYTP
jgi:hypothetical protein